MNYAHLRDGVLCYPSNSLIGHYAAAGRNWDGVLRPIVANLVVSTHPTIVDVGANIGATLLQYKAVKPNARVLCVEPSARFRRYLHETVRANGWLDVEISDAMLGQASGTATLYVNTTTASTSKEEYGGYQIVGKETHPIITLDALLDGQYSAWPRGRLDFLKVDTDGSDYAVLLGATETLTRNKPPVFFEFYPELLADGANRVIPYLNSLGYEEFLAFSNYGEALLHTRSADMLVSLASAQPFGHVDILTAAAPIGHLFAPIGSAYSMRPR
jgi:FkbM family methyltransferase